MVHPARTYPQQYPYEARSQGEPPARVRTRRLGRLLRFGSPRREANYERMAEAKAGQQAEPDPWA